jgi:hypothetical protein
MLAWLLEPIASGLARIYGRPLSHDVAVVFVVAFVLTVLVATRWSRSGASGVTAAFGVPMMSPSGTLQLLVTAPRLCRHPRELRSVALTIAACVLATLVTLLPLVVGSSIAMQGDIPRGVVYTLLGYLWIWMFLGLLPIWIVAGWYEYGFWQSLLGNGLMFVMLCAPQWLLARARRAEPAAGDPTAHAAAEEGTP